MAVPSRRQRGCESATGHSGEGPRNSKPLKACIVGGHNIYRSSLTGMLARHGVTVCRTFDSQEQLVTEMLQRGRPSHDATEQGKLPFAVMLLIVPADRPFSTYYQVRRALNRIGKNLPLVVLAEEVTRGQIHAALNTGAKAFLDCRIEPEELAKAIRIAASGRVYLPPEAVEHLLESIPELVDTEDEKEHLSYREKEILRLLCEGVPDKEAARLLHLAVKTVKNHRSAIYHKCRVHNVAQLVRHAIRQGYIPV